MKNTQIKISKIVENQLPQFVKDEYPLLSEFLSQYYISLESQSLPYDLIRNLDEYLKVDSSAKIVLEVDLLQDVDFQDDKIYVSSVKGFPDTYGLIKIDDEIITYTGIDLTENAFTGCIRGFSGVTNYESNSNIDQLEFSTSEVDSHDSIKNISLPDEKTKVYNLSVLFFKTFLLKLKKQFLPGFEDRNLSEINPEIFLKQSKDFYSSKGTDKSFKLLFKALYGEDVNIIKPRDFLLRPSDAQYRIVKNIVAEKIYGDPEKLVNRTLFQDQYQDINKSFGSVTYVERILREDKEYYIISIDNESSAIFGDFSIHAKTKSIGSIAANSNTITVDSTIGFPDSGEIYVEISENQNFVVTYSSKTYNQFIGCENIITSIPDKTVISSNTFAYAYINQETNEQIKIRINGVINDINIPNEGFYYSKDDECKIKTLGYISDRFKDNNWIFNVSTTNEVENFYSTESNKYNIITYDYNNVFNGDRVEIDFSIIGVSGRFIETFVASVTSQNIPGKSFQITTTNKIKKIYSTKRILNISEDGHFLDVQNAYIDSKNDFYVTSSSIPNYFNRDIQSFSITFTNIFDNQEEIQFKNDNGVLLDHPFYTGDSIVYDPSLYPVSERLDISKGVYFVKKIDSNTIKISRSRANIDTQNYIKVTGNVKNNKFISFNFTDRNLSALNLGNQKLIRKIINPIEDNKTYMTNPGSTGILLNGVEILNYKSDDYVYYGPIESIDVIDEGDNYDVINPPILNITPGLNTSISAEAFCGVEGSLKRIDVIDGGFGYIDKPIVNITGGSGNGAKAEVNIVSFNNFKDFNSTLSGGKLNLVTNTIGFSTYHMFNEGERVTYKTNGNTSIGGITTNASYYVSINDLTKVRLHNTYSDAISGINTINLTSFGTGNHTLLSLERRNKIESISILNEGSGYKNRKITIPSVGINTSTDIITAKNHKFNTGEIVVYSSSESLAGGLENKKFYILKIDEDSFRLCGIGTGDTSKDFYIKNSQFIDITTIGSGEHTFNYEPIKVEIVGKIGISTNIIGSNLEAIVHPVFRGKITSTFLTDGGTGYGSTDIINYEKQPTFTLKYGKGSLVKPIISESTQSIVEVVIQDLGYEYNSPPDVIVRGSGIGAKLTPILLNGKIIDIKVINGGVNYKREDTFIEIVSPGSGAVFKANINKWNIDLQYRLKKSNQVSFDDGVLFNSRNQYYGLQYYHLYSPQKLRESLFCKSLEDDQIVYRPDSKNDTEVAKYHSPILGWAYDGNPIYGPYGYENPSEIGKVKQLVSGYEKITTIPSYRPSIEIFEFGIFVEDYYFSNNGDLDECNGRFCKTPEFPNGTYAYFSTITNRLNLISPTFPYFIGNTYKSRPIDFNLDRNSNQDIINPNSLNLRRNSYPYNIGKNYSTYDYISNFDEIKKTFLKVKSTFKGSIDDFNIVSSGDNYKVGDKIIFNNENTNGFNATASVQYIKGKEVSGIACSTVVFEDVEFSQHTSKESIGFCTSPHPFKNKDIISISSLNFNDSNFQDSFEIRISSNKLIVTSGVGSTGVTGIITYFPVYGNLDYPNIVENDVYQIQNEKIKILNIDKNLSRIKVLRNYDLTVGVSYSVGNELIELPRKFFFNLSNDNKWYKLNRELYFNPKESLGIGTLVGIGSTVIFENPGIGITNLYIDSRSVYLPNHNLTKDIPLVYSSNDGFSFYISTDGINSYQIPDQSIVYPTIISNDFIGLSTVKVGLNTIGEYSGIGTNGGLLYFTGIGTGNNHSFKTLNENTLIGEVDRNTVTVSLSTSHSLKPNDIVYLNCLSGITTTVYVKYNEYNKRMVINPISFTYDKVDLNKNTITINNHGYYTGQKVIYSSNIPITGLTNEKIYYIVANSRDKIKLSETYSDSLLQYPITIDFQYVSTSSISTLSPINPQIAARRNQKLIFDLSDSSLSIPKGVSRNPLFSFDLYFDSEFLHKFYSSKSLSSFNVRKYGVIGVDTDARLELTFDDSIPDILYYNLEQIGSKPVYSDFINLSDGHSIIFYDSRYTGSQKIIGITTSTFDYFLYVYPEVNLYSISDGSSIDYYTDSKNENGGIYSIALNSPGQNYESMPFIEKISTENGSGAVVFPISYKVGKINGIQISDIGFNYPSDFTLRPTVRFPQVLKIEPLSTIKSIGITSVGNNYTIPADLIVLDGVTNKVVSDILLKYELSDTEVTILKTTKNLYNTNPRIVPINNSNGIGIFDMEYNEITKTATAYLNKEFSDANSFPFAVGDKVLVENTNIIETEENYKGYNSELYDYKLFNIVGVNTALGGGNASVTYSMANLLAGSQSLGTFDKDNSSGRIISEKDFPTFNIVLGKNIFFNDEKVISNNKIGYVQYWDANNEILKVNSDDVFEENYLITGKSSGSVGNIKNSSPLDTELIVGSYSIVEKGWNKDTGKLNNNLQRLHDNDYYQYFSYSLRSKIPYQDWKSPVDILNHTAGFKKFSDLIIESELKEFSGLSTSQDLGIFEAKSELNTIVDVGTISDFDLASEKSISINSKLTSDEIIFNSAILQDYAESIGNRALIIDDISKEFNTTNTITTITSFEI